MKPDIVDLENLFDELGYVNEDFNGEDLINWLLRENPLKEFLEWLLELAKQEKIDEPNLRIEYDRTIEKLEKMIKEL